MSDTRAVYKYKLNINGETTKLWLPVSSDVLSVGVQGSDICVWILKNPHENPSIKREFSVVGTGWILPKDKYSADRYIGKVEMDPFIWHVFEVTK